MTENLPKVKQSTDLAAAQALATDMGLDAISSKDIVIPRLHLIQNTSAAVEDGTAKLGDLMNLQTKEIVTGWEKPPVEILPLKLFKTWRVMDVSGKMPKFLRNEDMNAKNENLPWEDNEGGKPIRRDYTYNYYVLLMNDIREDEAFPLVISLRRSSAQAGKQIATQFLKLHELGKKPYSRTAKLTVLKKKFEQNTYTALEFAKGEKADEAALKAAQHWLGKLGTMKVADEEDDDETAPRAPAQAPVVVGDVKMSGGTPEEGPY